MNGLLVALVGVSGTLAGIIIKAVFDRFAEQGRRDREDVVWRRENALTSAAEFLAATSLLHIIARMVHDLSEAIVRAETAGNVREVHGLSAQFEHERLRLRAVSERASDALSRLSILLEQETFIAASQHLMDVLTKPKDAGLSITSAALNNLIRADLGLPERVVDQNTAITQEEALRKIEEIRKNPPTPAV